MHPGIHGQTRPDKPAYIMASSGEQVDYRTLNEKSNQAAHLFRHLGLKRGDGIAILLPNHVSFLQITWGAQRSGLYYTPISTLFNSDEVAYIVENSDASVVISCRSQSDKLKTLDRGRVRIFLVDAGEQESWPQAIAEFPVTAIADECEGAEMLYSSGTTGHPKGVRFPIKGEPLGTTSALFKTRSQIHKLSSEARYLSPAPLYHSAPLRYNMMMTRFGATSIIMDKFDAEQALILIEAHRITHSQWVPTMFVRLLKLPISTRCKYDLSSQQVAIHAAAPCPQEVKQQMMDWWGPILYEYYSGTEANGSTAISPEEWITHRGSVGRAIHGTVHILDEDERELPNGEIGTVYFSDGSDFHYHKDPEKTAAAKTSKGWSTLFDIGYQDKEGYLYLRDRRSFMIISGGVNIYPQEAEDVLIAHPKVLDAAVFGVPDPEFGESVKAVIQLLDQSDASEQMSCVLIDYCRSKLSHVKCPKSIEFMEELPRHPNGKLFKRLLRDPYWKDHDSRII